MLKKLLMFVGLLAILGIGAMFFLENKIESKFAEKEPEFRQYVTMTPEEQNAYIEKNLFELLDTITNYSTRKEQATVEIENLKADPEALKAAVALGRSMVASLILANENILKDLSAEVHNKLQAEADEGDSRAEKFKVYSEKYFPSEKKS